MQHCLDVYARRYKFLSFENTKIMYMKPYNREISNTANCQNKIMKDNAD